MDIPRTIGYTEIVKIAECALNGDSERAKVFIKRYIGKYPDKDLVYPFTHLLNGVTNPSGLNSNIIPACEGKADSTSEKDLRVCEVIAAFQSDSMKQNEFILCAAIDFRGTIICGHRHSDCYTTLRTLNFAAELPERDKQGFLTSQNRFVDRKEAWKIAKVNKQIQFGLKASENEDESILISENLY